MIILKGIKIPKIRGIALFPFIIFREREVSDVLVNHERIHIRQQLEMLVLPFYLWYVGEWLFHYYKVRNFWAAYSLISFEKEAYANEESLNYLKDRRFWAFLKWL